MNPLHRLRTPGHSPEDAIAACQALRGTDDPEHIWAMLGAMQDFGPVNDAVGEALRASPNAKRLLLDWMANPHELANGLMVVKALEQLGMDDDVVVGLILALEREDPEDPTAAAAQSAALALGYGGALQAVPHMVALGESILNGTRTVGYPERLLGALTGALAKLADPQGLPFVARWFAECTQDGHRDSMLAGEFWELAHAAVKAPTIPPEVFDALPTIEHLSLNEETIAIELFLRMASIDDTVKARLEALIDQEALDVYQLQEPAGYCAHIIWEMDTVAYLRLWRSWPAMLFECLNQTLGSVLDDHPPATPNAPELPRALLEAITRDPDAYELFNLLEAIPLAVVPIRDELRALCDARGTSAQIDLVVALGRGGVRDERLMNLALELLESDDDDAQDYGRETLERFENLPDKVRQRMARCPS